MQRGGGLRVAAQKMRRVFDADGYEHVAEIPRKVVRDLGSVRAVCHRAAERVERLPEFARHERGGQLAQKLRVRAAGDAHDVFVGHEISVRHADDLIGERQRVAHAAFGQACD